MRRASQPPGKFRAVVIASRVRIFFKIIGKGDSRLFRLRIARQHVLHRAESVPVRVERGQCNTTDFQIFALFRRVRKCCLIESRFVSFNALNISAIIASAKSSRTNSE